MKMNFLSELFANVGNVTWQHAVMWCIGGVLIYLAIAKKMEPALLLPIGFGTILVNLPLSGAVTQGEEVGVLTLLFDSGIANELFPLLLFIGIGAMIDFEPLLSNPKLFLFGAAAQFGIFFTLSMARLFNFDLHRDHRCGGRPDLHFCRERPEFAVYRRHHRGGILVYGACAHCAAAGHPPADDQNRAAHPHGVHARLCLKNDQNSVSCPHHGCRRHCVQSLGGAYRLFDVRQSAARVRRVKQPFGCRAERAVQLDHPDSRHHDHRTYDGGGIFARGHAAYFRTGSHCIRV